MHHEGILRKMESRLDSGSVEYGLPLGKFVLPLNTHIGKYLSLQYRDEINCIHCGRRTSRSFNQGYCFPCMRSLAECDSCIVRPETCHFAKGTCRDEQWANDNCMQEHYVYLANTSGVKVGITRGTQVPTRWVDQGAVQALPIIRVSNRLLSGRAEVLFKQQVSDRTDWRRMLAGEPEPVDLAAQRDALIGDLRNELEQLIDSEQDAHVELLTDQSAVTIRYPILEYPGKVTSLSFDKMSEIHGRLIGIKGQYLILDKGVINIRKFAGYRVRVTL
jgi:hypothetical protein